MKQLERDVLGEPAVYPGHPVTLALLVIHEYPSLAAAEAKGREFPAALENNDIPGAGGNVYAALSLLRMLHTMPFDEAVGLADRAWAECDNQETRYSDRWRMGQEQADRWKHYLAARSKWWGR